MKTITASQLAVELGVTRSTACYLCKNGRVVDAVQDQFGRWIIPYEYRVIYGKTGPKPA